MVTFLLPHSQALEIAECPNHLAMVHNEKEVPRPSFHRTSSKSPERSRHRTDSEEKPSRSKSTNRNSWLKSITSSFTGSSRTEPTSCSPLDGPTHVHRRTRSLFDWKLFTSQAENPRLPDHMKRPELQLRRIQGRDLPTSKPPSNRSNSLDQTQRSHWWPS